jgi:hypothetical protein
VVDAFLCREASFVEISRRYRSAELAKDVSSPLLATVG